jgi:DUF177 domain-containing protein
VLLNLAALALRGGERYDRTYPLELEPILWGGVDYRVLVPGGVRVTVDRITGGYLVGVALDAKIYGACARCLGEAVLGIRAEQQEFAPTAKDGWEETDTSEFIRDLVVDVDGLAREALVLALPAQVVCSEACKGLCSRCGKDLNKGPCGCSEEQIDERWSRLRDLNLDERGVGGGEEKGVGDSKA